jgi:group I intron endonuclease
MIGIYKITSPTKRIYIGQSMDIDKRFNEYKLLHCKSQTKLYNSLKKYGHEKHKFEIITTCEVKQLNELERYYQDCYNVISKNGLNCILTKASDRSGEISDETRKKLSALRRGNKNALGHKHSDEARLKISEAHKGNKYSLGVKHSAEQNLQKSLRQKGKAGNIPSIETRLKMSEAKRGKKFSEERKQKMSEVLIGHKRNLGKKQSDEHKRKTSERLKGNQYAKRKNTLETELTITNKI